MPRVLTSPAEREPAPFVNPSRSRTVANLDSIGFVERLLPVDQDPPVQTAWAAVLAARQDCREAGERLTRVSGLARPGG